MQSLWMLAASLLFALMAACSKLGAADFGTMELVFYRSVFGTAVIGLWVLSKGFTVRTPLILSHIKRSFLGTFGLTIWFYAIAHLPLGTAMTLNYTSPLYMAAFVAFMTMRRHEGQSWGLLASVAAGFLGITLVLQPEVRGGDELPALVGLASGFFAAWAYLQVKELSAMHEPEWRIVFYFTVFGTLFGLVGSYVVGDGMHMPDLMGWLGILGMGACATLGQICTTRSYAYGNMLLSSCLGFSAIPISAVISFFLFGETVSAVALVGMSLIIASGMTASVTTKRAEAAQAAKKKAEAAGA